MSARNLPRMLLLVAAVWPSPARANDDEACRAALEKAHPPGSTHGVVVQPEVPTRAAQDGGIVKHDRQYVVAVVDGEWRHVEDAVQMWEESFRRGEVLRLDSVRCRGPRVELRFVSVEDHYVPGGLIGQKKMRPVATTFRLELAFRPRGDADVDRVVAHVEPLVRLFPDRRAAEAFGKEVASGLSIPAPRRPSQRGEVQLGMSEDEVVAVLGAPLGRSTLGRVSTWTYPGKVVEFRDGHVHEVTIR